VNCGLAAAFKAHPDIPILNEAKAEPPKLPEQDYSLEVPLREVIVRGRMGELGRNCFVSHRPRANGLPLGDVQLHLLTTPFLDRETKR
jgi:hypothetical protein